VGGGEKMMMNMISRLFTGPSKRAEEDTTTPAPQEEHQTRRLRRDGHGPGHGFGFGQAGQATGIASRVPDEDEGPDELDLAMGGLSDDKRGVTIQPTKVIDWRLILGTPESKTVFIGNNTNDLLILAKIEVMGHQTICKFDAQLPPREAEDIIAIVEPNSHLVFKIHCTPLALGRTRDICVFKFQGFSIARKLSVNVKSDQCDLIRAIQLEDQTARPWRDIRGEDTIKRLVGNRSRKILHGPKFIRPAFFSDKRFKIKHYDIPDYMWEIVQMRDESKLLDIHPGVDKPTVEFSTYVDKFKVGLWMEEMEGEILRTQYDIDSVIVQKSTINECYYIEVPNIRNITPQLILGDRVTVYDNWDPTFPYFDSFIHKIDDQKVYLKFIETFDTIYKGTALKVEFQIKRSLYRRCHFAIEQAKEQLGENWLFPKQHAFKEARISFVESDEECGPVIPHSTMQQSPIFGRPNSFFIAQNIGSISHRSHNSPFLGAGSMSRRAQSIRTSGRPFTSNTQGPTQQYGTAQLNWFNKVLNSEQKNAVRRVLVGTTRPLPYVIYGPPGTGKTVTSVEAILQVYTLDPNSRILVVAPSNSAADVIVQQIASFNVLGVGDFVRLVGFSRQESQFPKDIVKYCVYGDKLQSIAELRLIICTCGTAGQFYDLGVKKGHFTHVFIDEAGCCVEPEALIAATLVTLEKDGQMILSGDPKQLGPVIMSRFAKNSGLGISFLERLTTLPLYARDEKHEGKYNPYFCIKLLKNYRSHTALLKFPSTHFYDDELIPAAADTETSLCKSLTFLPPSGGPLIFHGIKGKENQERSSSSRYNSLEVIEVINYVEKLRKDNIRPDDIGIITPYRKQVEKIRLALREKKVLNEDEDISIGTVEQFQGSEKKVIILSLVRSPPNLKLTKESNDKLVDSMSFSFSQKRVNVAITRAKALLIVLGNPHVFWQDSIWRLFILYCMQMKCYIGCDLPLELNAAAKEFLETAKENIVEKDMETMELPFTRSVVNNYDETAW